MKKSLAMLMTLLFVLLGTTAWAQSYKAGVYTAQANGNNGPVTVEVEVSDAEILSVKVTEHAETAGLSDTPIERIPAEDRRGTNAGCGYGQRRDQYVQCDSQSG